MTEVAQRRSAAEPGMALLPLKFAPPPARSEVLLRPDLQALLAEVRLRPATLVTAPAGYGKTTLLTQWVTELSRTGASVCWLGLDAGDSAPALLLAYLINTFQPHLPDIGEQAWRILQSAVDLERDWPLVAGALLSELQSELSTPTFLIIDDFHLIADGPITGALLGYLLRTAPPAMHIVVASRRPVSIAPLPRMRAEGQLVEVAQTDLSLTWEEASALLERSGVVLSNEDLQLLLDRTEGWVLSVQLAARALARQAPEQRQSYLNSLDNNQQQLFDYLASEVMDDLPPDLISFLSRAALADQVESPILAEALLLPEADQLLSRSLQMGLPITAIDSGEDSGRSYRFHPLWQRLLRERAEQICTKGELSEIHHRYGMAFERRGRLEAALSHFAAAGDNQLMARVLREQAWPLINTPQRDSIRAWIERIPADLRDGDPELLHMWGQSLAVANSEQALDAISRAAELYQSQGNSQRELRALSDMAALIFWEDRSADFAAVCVRAVRAANRGRDAWAHGAALASVVALLYSRGRYAAALRVANNAARHPRSTFWQWLLAMIVSSIQLQQGYPGAALATIAAALEIPQVDRDDRLRQNLLRLQAMALYYQGQILEATGVALDAHRRLSDFSNKGVIGSSAMFLALLMLEQGRYEEAATYLARARAVANRAGAGALLARVQVLDVYALMKADQPIQASDTAINLLRQIRTTSAEAVGDRQNRRDLGTSNETPFAALGTHDLWMQILLLIALGEGGEADRATSLADDLVAEMSQRGDGLFLALARFYRASLAERSGNDEIFNEDMRIGWEICEEHGFGYLPFLPPATIEAAAAQDLQMGIATRVVGEVLRRQMPTQAPGLLLRMLETSPGPHARARIAQLLGDAGAASAYPALRSMLKDRHGPVRLAAEHALERLVYRPAYTLHVRSLGGFSVWRGDTEIRDRDWRSVKARQLLQLLLVERGRMLPRDRIMDMLWPGLEAEAAANNLRVTLSRLTKAIEPNRPEGAPTYYVVQQGDTYGFNIESDHSYDAAKFSINADQARNAFQNGRRDEAIALYRKAIELYGGTFLPDCLYEDWSVVERERLSLLFTEVSLRLGGMLIEDGFPHEAIGMAWRVLEYDQAQEEAYQLLMRAYGGLGERSTALRLYARCVAALEQDLGVEPLPETIAIYHQIKARTI
ncbi:MAG: transcriptional regulator [Oscillochloris sp.]|nr:transcriptional regulator [Oscillochloris sp.]